MELTSVAVYRRRVRASLGRIWENVLDWEHLPWLHRDTFRHVRLLHADADGWRAESALADGVPFVLDVRLDRSERLYRSRTVDGPGAGTDIVTQLHPVDAHLTDIVVDFLVPDVPPERVDRVGALYVALYTRLWDQDESMMVRRRAVLDAGAAVPASFAIPLGQRDALVARLPLVVETPAGPVRILELEGALHAHATVCPHRGGPLDGPVVDGVVTCPWHGYRFDCTRGTSADGRDLALSPTVHVTIDADGRCTLAPAPDRASAQSGTGAQRVRR